MPGEPSEDVEMIRALCESVARFGRDRLDARRLDQAATLPRSLLAELAELGTFGLSVPEPWGGMGLSMSGVATVVRVLARYDRAVATTVGLHAGLGTRGLVAYGDDAQKRRWLPDLATGKRIAAFATTEPEAGSDLAAIRTQAVPTEQGLRVTGTKIYVTNGGIADLYTVTASTPGLGEARRGHGLLVLEHDDRNLAVGLEEDKLGIRASSTTSLHLDRVELSWDRLLGPPGQGMAQLAHVLAWGRTLMAAGCLGTADTAIQAALTHTSVRRQFGRTLDRFEVVQDQLAGMAATRFAMASLVDETAGLEHDHDALLMRSLSAKVLCSAGAWEICDQALQLHGGAGYVEDTGVALLLRDARITPIFEGANDVLRVRLGMHEATRPVFRTPLAASAAPRWATAADALADRIAAYRTHLVEQHGLRLLNRQRLLHRLGSMVVLRNATDAAVRNATHEPEHNGLVADWLALAESRFANLMIRAPVDRPADQDLKRPREPS